MIQPGRNFPVRSVKVHFVSKLKSFVHTNHIYQSFGIQIARKVHSFQVGRFKVFLKLFQGIIREVKIHGKYRFECSGIGNNIMSEPAKAEQFQLFQVGTQVKRSVPREYAFFLIQTKVIITNFGIIESGRCRDTVSVSCFIKVNHSRSIQQRSIVIITGKRAKCRVSHPVGRRKHQGSIQLLPVNTTDLRIDGQLDILGIDFRFKFHPASFIIIAIVIYHKIAIEIQKILGRAHFDIPFKTELWT